jgi:hypothetical protein
MATKRKREPYAVTKPGNPPGKVIPASRFKCLDCGGYAEHDGARWTIRHRAGCGTPEAEEAARAERVRQLAAEIHAARCHPRGWTPMAGCWGPSEEDRAEAERTAA